MRAYILRASLSAVAAVLLLAGACAPASASAPPANTPAGGEEFSNAGTAALSVTAPDLIIDSITWSPENLSGGDNVVFSVVIRNQGGSDAPPSRVNFYIDGNSRGYNIVPGIGAGDNVTETFAWAAQAGSHAILAVADGASHIFESDEANNARTAVLETVAPDLIVTDITWSPASPSPGDNITFMVTVKNQGGGKAGSSRVAFYVDATFLDSSYDGPLAPGAAITKTFIWEAQSGPYSVEAVADANREVVESDETNNAKTKAVNVPRLTPDLIIGTVTWSPETILTAHGIVFTVTMRNQGDVAAGYSLLYFYVDDDLKGYEEIQGVDAGEKVTTTFTWTAQAGAHTVKAVADGKNYVTESDENNNARAVAVSGPSKPDLVISDIIWSPASPSAGDNVTVTVTVMNQGGSQTITFPAACYIDSVYLGSVSVEQLAPGDSATRAFFFEAQEGSFTIAAFADSDQTVAESDENNNTKTAIFSILAPDLVITNIAWSPASPSAGDNVTFTVTVANQGGGPAGPSGIDFYSDGSFVGHSDVPGVDTGADVTAAFAWTAGEGSHDIKAVADMGGQVFEGDESNNEQTVTVSVSPLPAAIPAPVPAPETGLAPAAGPEQVAVVSLSPQNTQVSVGEDIVLGLSVANPETNPVMTVNLTLEVPPGANVTSPEFAQGSDGRAMASYSVAPGDTRQIEVHIRADQEGIFGINGDLTYYLAGYESSAEHQTMSVLATAVTSGASPGKPSGAGPAGKGIWPGWWAIIALLISGGAVIIFKIKRPAAGAVDLNSKLETAIKSLEKENDGAAIYQLRAFITEVESQKGRRITVEKADKLVETAQRIIANIS